MANVKQTIRKETKTIEVEVPTVTIELSLEEAQKLHYVLGSANELYSLYVLLNDIQKIQKDLYHPTRYSW